MAEQAVVKIKLQLDDRAADTTKKFTAELQGAAKQSHDLQSGAKGATDALEKGGSKSAANMKGLGAETAGAASKMGMLKGAVAAAGAALVAASVAGVAFIGAGAIASMIAANGQMEKLKGTTAMLVSLSPDKNVTFAKANESAKAFEATFRKISITAQVSRDDIRAAFQTVAAQTGTVARLTMKDTETITRNMAMSSRVVPGGLGALTKEYENLKTGVFSSSGSIVQMITSTGVLKGNAVEVAKQLASKDTLTRMKIAEEAMAKMAKTAGGSTGFAGLKEAFSSLGGGVMETMGTPIINKVLPIFQKVIGFFEENDTEIQSVADHIGNTLGDIVDYSSKFMSFMGDSFGITGKGVSQAIKDAADYVKAAFGWVYDNRDVIVSAFKAIKDIMMLVINGIMDAGKFIQSTFRKVADVLDKAGGHKGMNRESAAEYKDLQKMAVDPSKAGSEAFEARKKSLEVSLAAQGLGKEASKYVEHLDAMANKTSQTLEPFDNLANAMTDTGQKRIQESLGSEGGNQQEVAAQYMKTSVSEFITAYNEALKAQDDGKLKYVEGLVKGNKEIQDALITGGDQFEGGLLKFATRVGDSTFMKSAQDKAKQALGTKALPPQVNFNGATFNIKQDFRDQDPDRVAIVFRADIAKNAIAKTQASTSGVFGL